MYVYFDGESHFIRSEQCVREVFGADVTLDTIADWSTKKHKELTERSPQTSLFKGMLMQVDRRCKFFWDCNTFAYSGHPRQRPDGVVPSNMVYFSSCAGDDDLMHTLQVNLRNHGFEPRLVKERSQLAKQRNNILGNEGVIEKPKGVDISLTVRLLEDAQRDVFDECILFTSDVDYVPVIEAVQRMGKRVYVFGYHNGIGKNSAMEFVPDAFVDLTGCMKKRKDWLDYDFKAKMQESLKKLHQAAKDIRIPE